VQKNCSVSCSFVCVVYYIDTELNPLPSPSPFASLLSVGSGSGFSFPCIKFFADFCPPSKIRILMSGFLFTKHFSVWLRAKLGSREPTPARSGGVNVLCFPKQPLPKLFFCTGLRLWAWFCFFVRFHLAYGTPHLTISTKLRFPASVRKPHP
jgi:hypothetical protein